MTDTDDTVLQRLAELEIHSAFQSRTLAELDEVVREFAARVVRLERELGELRPRLSSIGADDDPPPDLT